MVDGYFFPDDVHLWCSQTSVIAAKTDLSSFHFGFDCPQFLGIMYFQKW